MVNFTKVKASTKKGQSLLWTANHNLGYNLEDVYKTGCSGDKKTSWLQWNVIYKGLIDEMHARNFRICSKNTWYYSLAWEQTLTDGERATILITKSNTYIILLDK